MNLRKRFVPEPSRDSLKEAHAGKMPGSASGSHADQFDGLAVVHGVDLFLVLLRARLPLDFHGRRQLARLLRESRGSSTVNRLIVLVRGQRRVDLCRSLPWTFLPDQRMAASLPRSSPRRLSFFASASTTVTSTETYLRLSPITTTWLINSLLVLSRAPSMAWGAIVLAGPRS